jgi:di/tricarboxylate transporter
VVVGGMIPLSPAMTDTGAAQKIADAIADAVGGIGPTRSSSGA